MKASNLTEWRQGILERDNHMCRDCGTKEKSLIGHHIKSQFLYPKYRLQIENGIALCRRCHNKRLGFALRLFVCRRKQGYLPKMPTAKEAKEHIELTAYLSSLPPEIRYAFHSRPYKIKKHKGLYWVGVPKLWVERELRKLNISLDELVKHYEAKWSYGYGLPHMQLKYCLS